MQRRYRYLTGLVRAAGAGEGCSTATSWYHACSRLSGSSRVVIARLLAPEARAAKFDVRTV